MTPRAVARILTILLLPLLTVAAHPSLAQDIDVSLPLRGHFRPGEYMPVRISLSGSRESAPNKVTLRAEGAVPTEWEPTQGAGTDNGTIVPWLPVRSQPGALTWTAGGREGKSETSLRPLGPDERLVGIVVGGDTAIAKRRLFPDQPIVSLPIEVSGTGLPEPIAAWEALDAVVLDQFPPPEQVEALLAAGAVLAVRSPDAPQDRWPWRLIDEHWILRRTVAGPQAAVLLPQAYVPARVWNPGRPEGFRRQVLLMALAFCILALGASLWRSRWAAAAVVLVAVLASGAIALWRHRQSPIVEATGGVLIHSGSQAQPLTQRDDWIFRRSAEPGESAIAAPGLLRPVFSSEKQIARTGIRLEAGGPDPGLLRFRYRLEPGWALAFMTRRIAPGRWPGTPKPPPTSPLRELLPLYLTPGIELLGEQPDPLPGDEPPPAGLTHWPAVVVEVKG